MKKNVWIWAVAVCWILCVIPVRADMIWEPRDSFYSENMESCEYLNRTYTANGPDGKVILYNSPKNPTVVTTWENGFVAYISFTYTDADGIVWGVYEDMEAGVTGWMPMDYMTVVYDYISFEEEFGEDIKEESGNIPAMYAGQTIRFWKYPGADDFFEVIMPSEADNMPEYSRLYVDETGQQWGYIGYYRGTKNRWVCLANATGELDALYPEGAPEVGASDNESTASQEGEDIVPKEDTLQGSQETEGATERIEPAKNNGVIGLVIGLVVAVTGVTGGFLMRLKKVKK